MKRMIDKLPEGAVIYATRPLGHNYTYTRDDGYKVKCYGTISDTPRLRIYLEDSSQEQTVTIQYHRTFSSGNILSTWRAWTKFLNKNSQFAGRIVRIESTNRKWRETVDYGAAQANLSFGESGRGKSCILKPLAEEHALPYFDCTLNEENEESTNRREFPTNSEK